MKLPDELVERAAKVKLADLRVDRRVPTTCRCSDKDMMLGWCDHVDGREQRSATLADLVEVALSEGGFVTGGVVMVNGNTYPESELHVIVLDKPGRYWVIPLDSKE